jgi:hypothetical protein
LGVDQFLRFSISRPGAPITRDAKNDCISAAKKSKIVNENRRRRPVYS